MSQINDHLVLICGKSATGKSASLRDLKEPEGVLYLNCESGKKLPFKSKFKEFTVVDPHQVIDAFEKAENKPEIHTIVVDSLTYLMDMYETQYVINSSNTMKAWGDFAQYFKKLLQQAVPSSTKNIIFTAHVKDQLNENEMAVETFVPIKGSIKNNGVESYFSCVIATKKMSLKELEGYKNLHLNITEEEESLGFKYVFQTKITKETRNERIRSSMGMWKNEETFIDNDAQIVIDRLREYYS